MGLSRGILNIVMELRQRGLLMPGARISPKLALNN